MQQKITPNLWFDGNAGEAAKFYCSAFPDSEVVGTGYYPTSAEEGLADFQKDMAGKIQTTTFRLGGFEYVAINAGPEFKPTPAHSCMVNFDPSRDVQAREHMDEMWARLIDGGTALMPLQKYDFSEYYGWVQDRYGFSWQLILTRPEGEERPFIIPSLLFGGAAQNRALEAIEYYVDVCNDAKKGVVVSYHQDTGPARAGRSVLFSDFMLENQWFTAMDSGADQDFTFTEAVSYSIACKDQAEIDYFWEKLSKHPENEQCGWCKDQFGVSWQIVPANMGELMQKPDAYKTMMAQKKIVIAEYK
jgi:predicted 3-demethylubiquinone-9 3-methyltransferase (glyoxalase superfamily)